MSSAPLHSTFTCAPHLSPPGASLFPRLPAALGLAEEAWEGGQHGQPQAQSQAPHLGVQKPTGAHGCGGRGPTSVTLTCKMWIYTHIYMYSMYTEYSLLYILLWVLKYTHVTWL